MLLFVNKALKQLGLVGGEQEELLSFQDSSRRRSIDVIIEKANETVHELYTGSTSPIPSETREKLIHLEEGKRLYPLPENLIQIRWPLINERDSMTIYEWPGGYDRLREFQLKRDQFRGTPYRAVIHPNDGKLYMDRIPLSSDEGRPYTLYYDRMLRIDAEGDIFPFNDMVATAILPAVVERYKESQRGRFNSDIYNASMARAMDLAKMKVRRRQW